MKKNDLSDIELNQEAFNQAIASYAPSRRVLIPVGGSAHPSAGQVWNLATPQKAETEEDDDQDFAGDDPWVLIVKAIDTGAEDLAFLVAPIFPETEYAGPDDVILKRSIIGFNCAIAMGATIVLPQSGLTGCEGQLPNEIWGKLEQFHNFLNGISARPDGVVTGLEYLGETDIRFVFLGRLFTRLKTIETAFANPVDHTEESTVTLVEDLTDNLINVVWLPEIEVLAAATPPPGRFQTIYGVARRLCILRVSLEPDFRHCWMFTLDEKGNPSSELDGSEILDAKLNQIAVIKDCQCRLEARRLAHGFVVRTPDGKILTLKATGSKPIE